MTSKQTKQSKGGQARAAALTPEQRSEIARKGGYGKVISALPKATHRGSFKEEFGIDVDCYVLDDEAKTAVISKRGMGTALGMGESGSVFSYFIKGTRMAKFVGSELAGKLDNPMIFHWRGAGASGAVPSANGYDVTILIDVCKVILAAEAAGVLKTRHRKIVAQANVIINASAKAGIKNLVYALAGYNATRDEVIAAFKLYVQEEARMYEREFPEDLYREWYRLYELTPPERNRPWKFRDLTIKQVYTPLARSNGVVLSMARTARGEDRHKKLHQFLTDIGVKRLRTHLGQLLGIAQLSDSKAQYERNVEKIFGPNLLLDLPEP